MQTSTENTPQNQNFMEDFIYLSQEKQDGELFDLGHLLRPNERGMRLAVTNTKSYPFFRIPEKPRSLEDLECISYAGIFLSFFETSLYPKRKSYCNAPYWQATKHMAFLIKRNSLRLLNKRHLGKELPQWNNPKDDYASHWGEPSEEPFETQNISQTPFGSEILEMIQQIKQDASDQKLPAFLFMHLPNTNFNAQLYWIQDAIITLINSSDQLQHIHLEYLVRIYEIYIETNPSAIDHAYLDALKRRFKDIIPNTEGNLLLKRLEHLKKTHNWFTQLLRWVKSFMHTILELFMPWKTATSDKKTDEVPTPSEEVTGAKAAGNDVVEPPATEHPDPDNTRTPYRENLQT